MESGASLLSRLTWSWMEPLMSLGNKRTLEMEDLHELDKRETAASCERRWRRYQDQKNTWITGLKFMGSKKLILLLVLRPLWLASLISQVYILKEFIRRARSSHERSWSDGLLVAALFLLWTIQSQSTLQSFFQGWRFGVRLRAALSMALFNKMLRMRIVERKDSTGGLMLNLISNDAQKLVDSFTLLHFVATFPLQLVIIVFFLLAEAGVSALPGIALSVIVPFLQLWMSKRVGRSRRHQIPLTDSRTGVITETLAGIRAIKFNGWTSAFLTRINNVRSRELAWIRNTSRFPAFMSGIRDGLVPFACLATFGVYVSRHGRLDTEVAFVVLSLFGILAKECNGLVYGLPIFFEATVAIERMQNFLSNNTTSDDPSTSTEVPSLPPAPRPVTVSSCMFSWDATRPTVNKSFSLDVHKGEVVGVAGRVGSGKSLFLYGLLGELKVVEGTYRTETEFAYSPQEPWILNDTVRNNILFGSPFDESRYNSVISACALEHDISALVGGSDTEIGERGVNLSGGQKARVSLARACYNSASLVLLDDPFSAVDLSTARHLAQHVLRGILCGRTVVVTTHSSTCLQACDRALLIGEHGLEPLALDQVEALELDEPAEVKSSRAEEPLCSSQGRGSLVKQEHKEHGHVKLASFSGYCRMAGWSVCVAVVMVFLGTQAVILVADYWLYIWTGHRHELSEYVYVACYAALAVSILSLSFLRVKLFYKASLTSASNMHERMIEKILRSPPVFFDQNPLGRILNRTTKDQAIADEVLPSISVRAVEYLASSLGGVVMIGVLLPWFLLIIPPLVVAFTYFQQRFSKVCRALKRLDAVSRSPIYALFTETSQGAVSVRAYNAEQRFQDHFANLVDANNKAYMLYVHATRWLAVRLDFILSFCILLAGLFVVLFRQSLPPGLTGVILVQTIRLDVFQMGVRTIAEAENHFTSIERILEYCHLSTEAEPLSKPGTLPPLWPATGRIEFLNVTLCYRENLPPVLHDITFTVEPMEKLGVVGRTGSGKSSLVSALFRMVENSGCSGSILVDGVNIRTVGLDDLRQKLSIIPQDPVLFSGTLRFNLDPFERHSDQEIYEALREAHFTETVTYEKSLESGLDTRISNYGNNFSLGERQLLCLARCMLRKSKVLILDEATAAVDNQTDQTVQATLRSVFRECTVLTVAHRLETVMDSDRILVLVDGRIAELDTPKNLRTRPGGEFANMLDVQNFKI